jgi:predicted phosphodiesterase
MSGVKLGVISDVHGDLAALQAVLARLDRLGVDKIVCAGDLVGNGPASERAVELVRERAIPTVRGNWDGWAVGRGRPDQPRAPASGKAWDALGLGLSKGSLHWLAHVAADWRQVVDGVSVCMFHGTLDDPMRGIFPETRDIEVKRWLADVPHEVRVLILGHTHVPMCRRLDGRLLCNPGTLSRSLPPALCPKGGGTYGVLTLPDCEFDIFAFDGTRLDGLGMRREGR